MQFTMSVNCKLIRRSLSYASSLTKNRYPKLKRGPYGSVTDKNINEFEKIVGKQRVLTNFEDVQPYNEDFLKLVCGCSRVVVKPKTVEELSAIMKICDRDRLAVCPQGGNTGLVGGSTPLFDEIIISMSLMNQILNIDSLAETLSCEAGCVVEKVNLSLEEHGLMLPHDLGSKGSCQIGGNISTCAGGLRLLRYGSFQKNVLGLEVVMANGSILNCMNALKKDNTGYHLRQLFIGSEGTLGIVTKAVIQCPVKPKSVNLSLLGLDSFSDTLKTMKLAKEYLSEIISSCEMMDLESMNVVTNKLGLKPPLDPYNFYMLIESHGSNEKHDSEKMSAFLDEAMKQNIVKDGITASEPSRIANLWQYREKAGIALVKDAILYQYDISLPVNENFYEIINELRERLKTMNNVCDITGFAHLGDGNLHVNVTSKEYDQAIIDSLEPFVFERVAIRKGSISAEHGIGFKKTEFLKYSKTMEAIATMKMIKEKLDPKGILNPYKVLM
ncbi:hypothetical protein O3M35_005510 [Rhynocoris fuscipes]|uniref:D-2-hydroxyglutarate dehydrogenase, mitochondrial n=1 Tax=Rhynocoris fuscipes TaxID=488301 RepID=A0AAW1DJS9_9HEMI